ncbi:hypothetical protein F5884DRAFT_696219, partial [Xylogone sp. PMI_703]
MSSIPSRTRSLRKPTGRIGSTDIGIASKPAPVDSNGARRPVAPSSRDDNPGSPSRLPVKPRSSTISTSVRLSSTTTISRTASVSSNIPSRQSPEANGPRPTGPGLQRSKSVKIAASQTSEPTKQDRSRPPVTTRHRQVSSTTSFSADARVSSHTRSKSSSTLQSNAIPQLRPPPSKSPSEESAASSNQAENRARKPAFSTLQQHYSPAKNLAPKPHLSAFLAPPSPSKLPANVAISAEIARLQSELLQLCLMHRDVPRVESEWKASAKTKLGSKFEDTVRQNADLAKLEAEEMGRINAIALKQWQGLGAPGWGIEEKIQVLGEVITGVWHLGEHGGKYARLVRKFEKWVAKTEGIMAVRNSKNGFDDEKIVFVEELDHAWKDDCFTIGRKLNTWKDQLDQLGPPPDPGSSLATLVQGCRGLVFGMLKELSIMAKIEKDAVKAEIEWIRKMNDDSSDDATEGTRVAGAIWR